jgi:hypothetical protein
MGIHADFNLPSLGVIGSWPCTKKEITKLRFYTDAGRESKELSFPYIRAYFSIEISSTEFNRLITKIRMENVTGNENRNTVLAQRINIIGLSLFDNQRVWFSSQEHCGCFNDFVWQENFAKAFLDLEANQSKIKAYESMVKVCHWFRNMMLLGTGLYFLYFLAKTGLNNDLCQKIVQSDDLKKMGLALIISEVVLLTFGFALKYSKKGTSQATQNFMRCAVDLVVGAHAQTMAIAERDIQAALDKKFQESRP